VWRYLAPNAVTAVSVGLAMLSIQRSVAGDPLAAAWFALYCVLSDKLDGFVARRLRAQSEFGQQFDSLADFAAFGIAPATLFYSYLSRRPELGFGAPAMQAVLAGAAIGYVLCVAFRLARFNVISAQTGDRFFFGVPTTLMGGTLLALFVTLLRYADPAVTGLDPAAFAGPRLFGRARLPVELLTLWPLVLAVGGWLMVSGLRVPKLARTGRALADAVLIANVVGVYGFGLIHWLPEYLAAVGLGYLALSCVYARVVPAARAAKRPRLVAAKR
jgi:CDP-diacylglycerol--serine O-phosphatidyltransferase